MSAVTNTPALTFEALSKLSTAQLLELVAANKRVISTLKEEMYGIKNWHKIYPVQGKEWNRCQCEKRHAQAILRERRQSAGLELEMGLGRDTPLAETADAVAG